jgi:hypothetical protein
VYYDTNTNHTYSDKQLRVLHVHHVCVLSNLPRNRAVLESRIYSLINLHHSITISVLYNYNILYITITTSVIVLERERETCTTTSRTNQVPAAGLQNKLFRYFSFRTLLEYSDTHISDTHIQTQTQTVIEATKAGLELQPYED